MAGNMRNCFRFTLLFSAVLSVFFVIVACNGGTISESEHAAVPVETGSLDVKWIHGSDPCSGNTGPQFQVHRYAANTYILRQNKCDSRHAPFSYLLFGEERAILFDTGAELDSGGGNNGLKKVVEDIFAEWSAEQGRAIPPLTVAHYHGHFDHFYADPEFRADENTIVVGTGPENVEKFFGITDWPNKTVFYDLGNRNLTVIPIPGHTEDSITIYDPWTHFLLTGDSVYPGTLFIPDWMSFKQSINKLASFANEHPISYILGTHIEMTTTPDQDYSGTYEPNEHALQLGVEHLWELRDSLEALGDTPIKKIHDDFIIFPRIFDEDASGQN